MTESNNPPLPEPDESDWLTRAQAAAEESSDTPFPDRGVRAVSSVKNSEPRRAYRRERLLQREDWPTLLVLVAFAGAAGFLSGILAIFLFT